MVESLAFQAFAIGIISACSLPLGTLTSAVWHPRDPALAVLMAFGGGALLAALTIDLVGSALEKGHFHALAFGCIIGGLLFRGLNQLVNSRGGFLRKASTTIYYIQRQQQRRFRRVLSQIGRIDVFRDLPSAEVQELAAAVFSREYKQGTTLYRKNDPSGHLYIIEKGEIELLDPQDTMRSFQKLKQYDAFGRMGFFTGAPRATVAVTTTDARVWVLPRHAFASLLKKSSKLVEAMQAFLSGEEVATYLKKRQGIAPEKVKEWVKNAVKSIQTRGAIQSAVEVERKEQEFKYAVSQVRRVPIFQQLPPEDVEEIASRIFSRTHERGYTFFHQNEPADRMYIIEHGEVALIDPKSRTRTPMTLGDHDAFGALSFLTGARHTVTAVAATETTVWVLRKRDFDQLLEKSGTLARAVREFLQQEDIAAYLQQKQDFDPAKAARWIRQAVRSIDVGRLIPSAAEMAETVKEHQGAPLAIWLGILLDGIPESLVIGSSLIHSHISFSLLAGLFLSNYPEALSSSVGMRQQGLAFSWILLMWTSLMVVTGVVAALGNMFFAGAQPSLFALLEGMAAGSMLTMIVETMLPEAYFKGGSIIGFTTLLGFLSAIFFKTLE